MHNRIIQIFVSLFFITTITGCSDNSKNEKGKFYLYNRNSGTNNGYKTYMDVLAITNYKNRSITIDSFARFAKNYVDTVKADFPVSSVIFIGQKPGGHLPKPSSDNTDEQVECYLLLIGFNNSIFLDTTPSFKIEIRDIAIWYDGELFHDWDRMMDGSPKIDSALRSKLPFDNGF